MIPPQRMTPEEALAFVEERSNADSERERHIGPKIMFVGWQIALQVLAEAIKPKEPKEKKENEGGKKSV